MENEFARVMSERTDDELIKIMTSERENYQSLAVEAAEKEIELRNINEEYFQRIKSELMTNKVELERVDVYTASKTKRFINFLIDTLIIFSIVSLSAIFLGDMMENKFRLIFRLSLFFYLGYYVLMETRIQKTFGKMITNTKVVDLYGHKPNGKQIFIRTLIRLFPFDPISFFFERKGYKFHDSLSKTKVITETKLD
ncbi:MAG: RDD family protein [Algicola sp.]|nr:RDD family protein [Algicola sp.]